MKELSDVTSQKQTEVPRSMRELEEADREQKKAEETAKVSVFATVFRISQSKMAERCGYVICYVCIVCIPLTLPS